MNKVKSTLRAVEEFQQRRPWLAFPVAVWKKFGDDQAGNLAALVAYYAFIAIFPLLLVLVTVLSIVLKNDPGLQQRLLNSALSQYPVIGQQLKPSGPLHQSGLALVVGLVGTFLGARGVATAMQNALNTAWEVPYADRPGFPWALLRSIGQIRRGQLAPAAARRHRGRRHLADPAGRRRVLRVAPAGAHLGHVRHLRGGARPARVPLPGGGADSLRGRD
jgi:hypothetical protein